MLTSEGQTCSLGTAFTSSKADYQTVIRSNTAIVPFPIYISVLAILDCATEEQCRTCQTGQCPLRMPPHDSER